MRAAAFVGLLLVACGGAPGACPAAPSDPASAKQAIAQVLDALNDAAAKADEPRYFALYAPDAVFLGTDGKERWDLPAFRAFAHPHFAKGKAWSFTSVRRDITIADGGHLAYFDEDLSTPNLGPCRGSGVLKLEGGAWKIAQYNLAVVVPNERFDAVRAAIEGKP